MTWVHRHPATQLHQCQPPMHEQGYALPSASSNPPSLIAGTTAEYRVQIPDGEHGDLWRCPCGRLWRLGMACDGCDRYGDAPHPGLCQVWPQHKWRPARWWQRLWYWRKGRS